AEQGFALLANIDRLRSLGFPVLIGASRKRMLASVLATGPEQGATMADRDLATAVVSALMAERGVWAVRVHDVCQSAIALSVAEAMNAAAHGPQATNVAAHGPRTRSAAPRDSITLTGLEVFAHHGVFDFERERGQR